MHTYIIKNSNQKHPLLFKKFGTVEKLDYYPTLQKGPTKLHAIDFYQKESDEILDQDFNEHFVENLTTNALNVKVTDSSAANKFSNQELRDIIKTISRDWKCTNHEAFAALALLAQLGLTSNRATPTSKVIIRDKNNKDTDVKIEHVRHALKPTKKSFRRLAKTYATQFQKIAQQNGYLGNLYNKIKLRYPDYPISEENKYWCSDFQSENEDCPIEIRKILNRHYNEYIKKKDDKK